MSIYNAGVGGIEGMLTKMTVHCTAKELNLVLLLLQFDVIWQVAVLANYICA